MRTNLWMIMVSIIMAVSFISFGGEQVLAGMLVVDDDLACPDASYTTIQTAVDAASVTDTVFVCAGTYYENVTIGRSVTLEGENRETAIINGGGSGNVVYVTASDVTISGLTLTNGEHGVKLIPNYSIRRVTIRDAVITSNLGVAITAGHSYSPGAFHVIEDCIISNNGGYALYAHQFSKSIVRNCEVFGNGDNSGPFGLVVAWGFDTLITGNEVHDNAGVGIWLDSMTDTVVENNNVYSNSDAGIVVGYVGRNNTIRDNIVRLNNTGIAMGGPGVYGNRIYHNDVMENAYPAWDQEGDNTWDDGHPSGGNYWSDYAGADEFSGVNQDEPGADGMGDTPFVFGNAQDNYPLMRPWNWEPCEPDPLTQGYWHRQCLGVGLISPGRNGQGRGPQPVLDPDFDKLEPDVSALLGNKIFQFRSCQDGMNADPPSNPCERAVKQYTALLFNQQSGRLQNSCGVDLSAEGCSSADIGTLVDELAGLINNGEPDHCMLAAECADAANKGTALLPGEDLLLSVGLASGTDEVTIVASNPSSHKVMGSTRQEKASPAERSTRSVAGTTSIFTLRRAAGGESRSTLEVPAGDPVADVYADVRSVERHLAVLHNSSAPERARTVSTDALLTALSGGYEVETRLEIVKELLDEVEESMLSLLAAHLRDIRDEARDFGKEELAKDAEGLLRRLEPSDE